MAGILGAQLDPNHFVLVEDFQGLSAPMGSSTRLDEVRLSDKPKTADMMMCVRGLVGAGGYEQKRGIDWDINTTTGYVYWLGRTALLPTQWLSFTYWPFSGGRVRAFDWRA